MACIIKKSKEYNVENLHLSFNPTHGKQIELTGDAQGKKYLMCKFSDYFGLHFRIYIFCSDNGMIKEELLRVQLCSNVEMKAAVS